MMRASILLLTLVCQVHAAHLRNTSKAVPAGKTLPAVPVAHATAAKEKQTAQKIKEDKEEKEAIGGLVNGLNKLDSAGGEVAVAMRQKANAASKVLVAHNTSHANATNVQSKPQTPKEKKEDKENKEAISGLVNGLSKLPMRNGKVSAVGARMANLKKKAALVSNATHPAQVSNEEQKERAQQALEKAEAAEKSVEQEKADALKFAEATREALKKKAAALVSHKMAPPTKGNATEAKILKNKKEKKEAKEGVAGIVNGLSKIPVKNGKVSPAGVRMANIAHNAKKQAALVSHAAPAAPVDPKKAHTAAPTKGNATQAQILKNEKDKKEAKEGVAGIVNGLSKIPVKNGKVSPAGVRMANIAHNAKKQAALVSHAAPAAPVDPKEAEETKKVQHAFELADEAEKTIPQEEKEAHEEAEEARKLVGHIRSPSTPSKPMKGASKYMMSKNMN